MPLSCEKMKEIRLRLITMHYESGVGHIGGNLSSIDAIMLLFHDFIKKTDIFVLSKGHSAGALYVTLWSLGILSDGDLKSFHREDTLLPGHPPAMAIPEIKFATGSLGHGLSLASGCALGFRLKNDITSKVYCLTSDGEWQEGSTWEALIFACHHKLKNLTILVDHNNLQGFGTTQDIASMYPLWEKIKGFDIDVKVVDGHDMDVMREVLSEKQEKIKIIFLKTIKGHGLKLIEGRMDSHYLPLNKKQYDNYLQEQDVL